MSYPVKVARGNASESWTRISPVPQPTSQTVSKDTSLSSRIERICLAFHGASASCQDGFAAAYPPSR